MQKSTKTYFLRQGLITISQHRLEYAHGLELVTHELQMLFETILLNARGLSPGSLKVRDHVLMRSPALPLRFFPGSLRFPTQYGTGTEILLKKKLSKSDLGKIHHIQWMSGYPVLLDNADFEGQFAEAKTQHPPKLKEMERNSICKLGVPNRFTEVVTFMGAARQLEQSLVMPES